MATVDDEADNFSLLCFCQGFSVLNRRDDVQVLVERYVDPWARHYVSSAMAGDVEAVEDLAAALSNGKRGVIAVAFWRARVRREAFRRLLAAVWEHDHRELIAACSTRRRLALLFRYAAFEMPALPEHVRVWRGTSGLSMARESPRLS